MRTYFCVYLGATFLALLTTPVVARIGRAMRILDAPDARKVHSSPTPRIGGLAIALPAIAMSISVLVLDNVIGQAFRLVRTHETFMGDCGSMFLGFVIATASVMCALKSATLAGLALPFLALGVPIFDAFFSILRRIVQRRSIFAPDRGHIHHRLLAGGLRQRRAVILMYVVTLIAGGLGTFMMVARGRDALVVFGCVFVLLVLVFRAAGAIGLGGSIAALRRNLAVAREAGQEKRHLEEAQLRLCGATTLDAWWQSMCATAEKMGFASLSVSVVYPEGPTRRLFWRPGPPGPPASRGVIHLVGTLPDDPPGLSVRIEADIPVDGSLESAGRRAALFGRLIDEQSLNELAPGQRAA